jgi:hypothetical protein
LRRVWPACARVPAFDAAHLGVKVAFERFVEVNDLAEVSPTQLSTQRVDNLGVRENLGEANHVEHICPGEAPTKLNGQLFTQCVDYLLAIFGALVLENVSSDALTNLPVKNHKAGIDSASDALAGGEDKLANVGQQGDWLRGGLDQSKFVGHGISFVGTPAATRKRRGHPSAVRDRRPRIVPHGRTG